MHETFFSLPLHVFMHDSNLCVTNEYVHCLALCKVCDAFGQLLTLRFAVRL